MRHSLTAILALHWAAAFAALAWVCVGTSGEGVHAFALLGMAGDPLESVFRGWPADLMTVAFAVVAVLFAWTLAAALLGGAAEDHEVARTACCAAVLVFSALLIVGVAHGTAGSFPALGAMMAALLASYLTMQVEQWWALAAEPPEEDGIRAAARLMAVEAAHSSMLAHLSGRPASAEGGA